MYMLCILILPYEGEFCWNLCSMMVIKFLDFKIHLFISSMIAFLWLMQSINTWYNFISASLLSLFLLSISSIRLGIYYSLSISTFDDWKPLRRLDTWEFLILWMFSSFTIDILELLTLVLNWIGAVIYDFLRGSKLTY